MTDGLLAVPVERSLTVVFVHGLNSGSSIWERLLALLAEDDALEARIRTRVFDYSSPKVRRPLTARPALDVVAEGLWTFITTNIPEHQDLFLVGHSQGGLILTLLLERLLADDPPRHVRRVAGVVFFACPNQGSTYAHGLRRVFLRSHAQEKSLRPLDPDIARAHRRVVKRTADPASSTYVPVLAVAGESDPVVSPTSAFGHWPETAVIPGNHSSLIRPQTSEGEGYLVLRQQLLAALARQSSHPSTSERPTATAIEHAVVAPFAQVPRGAGHEFVERLDETNALVSALRSPALSVARTVAIHGKPGVGKSTLAAHAANLLAADFAGGQCYIDMRGLEDAPVSPTDALGEVLQCLGVARDSLPSSLSPDPPLRLV